MTRSHSSWIAVLLLAGLALAACSRAPAGASPQPAPSAAHSSLSDSAGPKAFNAGYPYTEADVRFMSGMIGHHAQALVMAGWAPTHGASSSVRTLAERIINGQQDEIVSMQRWLRDRGQPVPEAHATGVKIRMDGAEHDMLMPGMLTEDQMRQLDQAQGPEFDRLFLRFMIQHHRGAVSMVKDLFGTNGAAQDEAVFKFANDVNVDQSTEIARMERMLAGLQPGAQSP
jgi:uncharacterized protein (DUF305 family)